MKNTQTSMVGKKHGRKTQKNMDKKYTKFTKNLLVEKIYGKPTVREKIKIFTNLTARCEPRHSTLSSWDKNYLNLFSSVHN